MKKISIKLQLFAFLIAFLAFVSFREGSAAIFVNGAIALLVSALTDSLSGFVRDRKLKLTESSLITGLLIGFVLSADAAWWSVALAAVIAIISKQLVRIKGRHIFNPAAFGAFAVVLLFQESTRWYGADYWYIVVPAGLYFVRRIKRLTIISAYYAVSALLYGAQAYLEKTAFVDAMIYLNHFFIFVMLIEPKTSPFDLREKIVYGLLAGAFCFGLGAAHFPFSAELPSLLLVNLGYILFTKRGGMR